MGFGNGFGEKPKKRFGRIRSVSAAAGDAPKDNAPQNPTMVGSLGKPDFAFKDVWCVCSVIFESGYSRPGVLLGICSEALHVRFRSKTILIPRMRVKASRLGLDAPVHLAWNDEFDAILTFRPYDPN